MLQLHFYPQAIHDLDRVLAYLAKENPEVAWKFIDAVEQTTQRLTHWPFTGSECNFENPKTKNIRVTTITRFKNHLIYFTSDEHKLEVIRIVHSSRDQNKLFEIKMT